MCIQRAMTEELGKLKIGQLDNLTYQTLPTNEIAVFETEQEKAATQSAVQV